MALFSQRKGLKPLSKILQTDSMDSDLRNSLWNALQISYWNKWEPSDYSGWWTEDSQQINELVKSYWLAYFKQPLDTKPAFERALEIIRDYFFKCQYHEVYDFIEFTAKHSSEKFHNDFRAICNMFLKKENSPYRFVDNEITQITAPEEIQSVEDALSSGIEGVRIHLAEALAKLSDRKNPDYRNSIKESISAVEAICRLVSGDEKATLGDALKRIGATQAIHPALEKAFSALYGYTNDKGGIRHALLEEATLSFTDAKFMLVTCSAFVNYVVGKAADLGISLKKA